ncbi:glycosyltransferase family 4 protein [Thalassoroseus pseudoceratinae]|uniref:glycosyltransferase family 4 protein n=1 Tax=Thalassoroseus pseudoceratinae TaxID=2713176 RepID=UPI0014242D01|nr:glycosyltransferase family 4 protein [Thalassoroseus pseudoceratinae]
MPRRVALLFEYGSIHGGENSILATIAPLQRDGWEFIAIAPPTGRLTDALREQDLECLPFELRREDGQRLSREQALSTLADLVKSSGATHLHANSLSMGRLTGALAEQIDIPTTAHLRDIMKLSRATITDLNQNRRLLAVSEATRTFHIEQGLNAERTVVVHNGITVDQSCRDTSQMPLDLRHELGVPADAKLLLTIGQIGLRKGLDVWSEAAISVGSQDSSTHFVLVGERFSTKPETVKFDEAISDRFAEAGMSDRLHRLGYRNDVPRLMAEADLLVHAAKQEPFGRVLLEAAACGLPIVATDVGGTTEMLTHRQTAWLVPAGDSHALTDGIRFVLQDPDRMARAERARQDIRNRFSIEQAANGFAVAIEF